MKTFKILGIFLMFCGFSFSQNKPETSKKAVISKKTESKTQTSHSASQTNIHVSKEEKALEIEAKGNQQISEIQANPSLSAEEKAAEIKTVQSNQKAQLLEFLTEQEYETFINQSKEKETLTE
jgi:hypothetical protein